MLLMLLLLLLLLLMLLLLLLERLEMGGGVETMALRGRGRGPRVGELGGGGVGHMVEVEGGAEALLMIDGHGHDSVRG